MIASKATPALAFAVILLLRAAPPRALEMDAATIKAASRFDGIVTHGWEHEAASGVRVNPWLGFNAALRYLDATQDSIAGIVQLRGQVVSVIAGASARMLADHLTIDAEGGVDGVLGEKPHPEGSLKLGCAAPIPANPVIQHLKLTPQAWYTHSMFNGPAIKNRIASYGFAGELRWSMGPKMAAAVNFRQEFLNPASRILNPGYTSAGLNGQLEDIDVDTDTLPDNAKTSVYGYAYRQLLTPLYIGYAYSWTSTRHDRRVLSGHSLIMGRSGGGPRNAPQIPIGSIYSWAYYPYPSPREMTAHIATLTLSLPVGGRLFWKSSLAVPVYSQQEVRYPPSYFAYAWGAAYPQPAYDRELYKFQVEKFTGPLTIDANIAWIAAPGIALTLEYGFFGFPYREWGYFTRDSYSLHTVSLELTKRFSPRNKERP